ncbi:MAG TPA: metallophosphoesterase family protein [Gaiellaceae bacterium]|jgi:predicted phosphodiesterase|nr:metallophosphoesterase family protein [Gaiellaceae bacterium]
MRVALIADVHGNAVGLDAVLAELEREPVDEIVSLGDVAQGGAQPMQVVERLRALGCRCVFGNSDEFLLTLDADVSGEELDEAARERLLSRGEWSQAQLGPDGLAFLRDFEPVVELDVDGERLVCCHATPASNTEVVLPDAPHDRIAALLGNAAGVVAGHVHLQWLRRVRHAFWACVGSAGLAYEHREPLDEQPFEPWAEYAVVSGSPLRIEFRRVPFDAREVVRAIHGSGMPDAERTAAQWRAP